SELQRLQGCAAGEVGPADPGGEAEVVLDPGAGGRLAAWSHRVEHHGRQTLRSSVERRVQPGWSRADDSEVDGLVRPAMVGQPEDLCEPAGSNPAEHRIRCEARR